MLNFNFAVILKTLNVDMWILVTSWSQAFPPPPIRPATSSLQKEQMKIITVKIVKKFKMGAI